MIIIDLNSDISQTGHRCLSLYVAGFAKTEPVGQRIFNLQSYSGTSLFQPHLGPTKVAGLVRWLDFNVEDRSLNHSMLELLAVIVRWPQFRSLE